MSKDEPEEDTDKWSEDEPEENDEDEPDEEPQEDTDKLSEDEPEEDDEDKSEEEPQEDTEKLSKDEPEEDDEDKSEEEPRMEQQKDSFDFKGHRYTIFSDAHTWKEAEDKCRERHGYLAIIGDSAENEALYQYMIEKGFKKAFFGMFQDEDTSTWKYGKGDTPSYYDWGANLTEVRNLDTSNGERCYALLDTHMSQGHWNAASFGKESQADETLESSGTFAYICEWND